MATFSTNLSDAQRDYLTARIYEEKISASTWLRHLVADEMRRADTEALNALSLDDLTQTQQNQARHLADLHGYFPQVLQSISDQLQTITIEQAQAAEQILQLHQQSLAAYGSTADLVVAALDQCQTIMDADNAILESIERRLKQGGR